MERNISNMPVQKLPMSKKTEEWRRDCVDYFIGISGFSSANSIPDEEELQSYYDLYNSIYNEKILSMLQILLTKMMVFQQWLRIII